LEQNLLRHARLLAAEDIEPVLFVIPETRLAEAGSDLEQVAIARHPRYFNGRAARELGQQIRQARVDVLWSRDPRDLSAAGKAVLVAGIPFVFQQGMQLASPKLTPWHRLRYSRVTRWIAPLHTLEAQIKMWTHVPHDRIRVIPLILENHWFEPAQQRSAARSAVGLPLDKRLVGCFGRLDPLKGQDTFIRALRHLPTIWHGVIVGENTVNDSRNFEQELRELAEAEGVADRLHFLPPRKDLRSAYDAVEIVAMCSVAETIGMVTLEAMAAGCGIVGTRSGGTPELLLQGRVSGQALFEPGNDKALAAAIEAGPFRADRSQLQETFGEEAVLNAWRELLAQLHPLTSSPVS
jgi:glycosyltransferase involved in cell wall biosynthesis